jgi:hypothetical protein
MRLLCIAVKAGDIAQVRFTQYKVYDSTPAYQRPGYRYIVCDTGDPMMLMRARTEPGVWYDAGEDLWWGKFIAVDDDENPVRENKFP